MPPTLVRRKTGSARLMAQTIRDVVELKAPDVLRIMDLTQPMTREFVLDVVHRGLFGYRHRRPVALYDERGSLQGNGTDFDLLSMMFALAERGAVIHIEEYRRLHSKQVTLGVRRVRDGLRFGHIVGPISNARNFTFSLRINDVGVIKKGRDDAEQIGEERTYAFTIPDGLPNGVGGVVRIRFAPDREENGWLTRSGVIHDGEALSFDDRNVVHVNRRQALGAAPYLAMKLLLNRLKLELEHVEVCCSSRNSKGLRCGTQSKALFEAVLEHPPFNCDGEVASLVGGVASALKRVGELRSLIQLVQFVVRADELAYWSYGYDTQYVNQWLGSATWRQWTLSGASKGLRSLVAWRRLDLGHGFALRVRAAK